MNRLSRTTASTHSATASIDSLNGSIDSPTASIHSATASIHSPNGSIVSTDRIDSFRDRIDLFVEWIDCVADTIPAVAVAADKSCEFNVEDEERTRAARESPRSGIYYTTLTCRWTGISRMRGPPAATMALASAGATAGVGGSPTPVGGISCRSYSLRISSP